MCALNNNTKTPTTSDELFCVIFVPDFSFIFFIFYSKKLTSHGIIIKPTKTERGFRGAAFKVQAGIPRSAFLLSSSSSVVCFCFLFSGALSLSLVLLLLLLRNIICVFKSLLSRRSFFLFVVIFPEMIKELPPKKKKKKKKKEKRRKSIASRHRFGFVVVSLKKNASLTFPLYVFNRTNRLGKRPSSLASCTTNSTPRIKRRSASIFYRKRYTWRILEAFDYNCGIQLARSDFDR